MQFQKTLLAHADKYPGMREADCVKLAYQHALGCEHMISDANSALARIASERADDGARFEDIGNGLARLHLSGGPLRLSSEAAAGMFAYTARAFKPLPGALDGALDALLSCADEGKLPVSGAQTREFVRKFRLAGCPALHHSPEYRALYAPAYRVVLGVFARCAALFSALDALSREKPGAIIAIDGMSASGKSTLAAHIQGALGASVFHMDDYFLPPAMRTPARLREVGGNVDRERFLREVLAPLRAGRPFAYRPYDCHEETLLPPVDACARALNVVEGAYACHPDLRPYYDLTVCLKIDPALQVRRVRERNGDEMLLRFQSQWIPMENEYLTRLCIPERADYLYTEA